MFGFLSRKIFIVMSVLRKLESMSMSAKNSQRTNQIYTALTMTGIWAVDAIIVGVWTGTTSVAPTAAYFAVPIVGTVGIKDYGCNQKNQQAFAGVLLAYKVVLILVGAAAAFRVRSIGAYC